MKRIFLILLVIALVAAAFYWLSKRDTPAPIGELSGIFAEVPGDAIAIAGVDLQELRESAFWQKTVALFPEANRDPEFSQFVKESGFDYERDLDRVVMAWSLAENNEVQTTAIAEGRFDREKIRTYAGSHGRIEMQDGVETYRLDREKESAPRLRFLNDSRVLITEASAAGHSVRKQASLGLGMREKLAEVSPTAIFAVIHIEALPKSSIGRSHDPIQSLQDLRGTMDWLTLAARPEDDRLRIQLQGQAPSTFKAIQAGLLLDGFKALGVSTLRNPKAQTNLSEEQRAALLDLLQKTQITREGERLQARLELTHAFIKHFVEKEEADWKKNRSVRR